MQLRDDFVAVTVPATSANLGPGFDSMGLALDLYDDVSVHATAGTTEVTVEGEGAGQVPSGEDHLVVKALRLALDRVGAPQVGIRMHCINRIPHGRGLGSSASAIVAGLALARGLVGDPDVLTASDLLELGNDMEGHPDNIAPAIMGGATIAWSEGGRAGAVRLDPPPGISPVAFIPAFELATSHARSVLPTHVPHADASFNSGRAALLGAVLSGSWMSAIGIDEADPALVNGVRTVSGGAGAREGDLHPLLMAATQDTLHQNYRRGAMEPSVALVEWLRQAGYAAVISGAGPTVLSLEDVPADVCAQAQGAGWKVLELSVAHTGVRHTVGHLTTPLV